MIETSTSSGTSVYFSGTYLIIDLILVVLGIVGLWMTLSKAGRPGWGAIIPFFNVYLIIKMAGRPGWWLILMFIPFVNFVILIIVAIDNAKNFGHGAGFGVLLWLFPFIMYLVLGFGSSQYKPLNA
jgi:Family of unknown function (DUF5684)